MSNIIKLKLTVDETNQVLAGVGELPSKTKYNIVNIKRIKSWQAPIQH
jgi:hypothetical protein